MHPALPHVLGAGGEKAGSGGVGQVHIRRYCLLRVCTCVSMYAARCARERVCAYSERDRPGPGSSNREGAGHEACGCACMYVGVSSK